MELIGSADPLALDDRLGVVAFNLAGFHHSQVAAMLAYEGGIGVRNGCFCAHPYILELLRVPDDTVDHFRTRLLAGDRSAVPGLVRVSFGCYNTLAEIDTFIDWMQRIRHGQTRGIYEQEPATGSYVPRGWSSSALAAAAFDL